MQLLDVRSKDEYTQDHVEGAILIPLDELRDRYSELDPKRPVVVQCRVGLRGGFLNCSLTSIKDTWDAVF